MEIDDSAAIGMIASAGALGAYFVRWLTSNMTEALKANTEAINSIRVIVERCRYKEN